VNLSNRGPEVHSHLPTIMESDSSLLIEAAKASSVDRSPFLHWVHEIQSLASYRSECVFAKVEQNQARVSDSLANLARSQRCTSLWLNSNMSFRLQLLELDRSVTLHIFNKVYNLPAKKKVEVPR
jgi:hypothetical protein